MCGRVVCVCVEVTVCGRVWAECVCGIMQVNAYYLVFIVARAYKEERACH